MRSRDEVVAELTARGVFELTEDGSAGYSIRCYKNAPASLRDVFLSAFAPADQTFVIYGEDTLTFGQFNAQVAALAHHLVDLGVETGVRVAIGMRNYPEWMVGFWACQAIGAVVVALNAWWTTPELSFALEDAGVSVLLVDGERLERIRPLLSGLEHVHLIVARREMAGPGGLDFADAIAKPALSLPDVKVKAHDLATILYTSGTTGKPKGAVATHRNHVTNLMNSMMSGAVARTLLGVPPEFIAPQVGVLQTFPFFHIGGLSGIYIGLAMGWKMALMYKWDAAQAVELIDTHRLSTVAGVPIVLRQLLEAAAASGSGLGTIAGVGAGGAPVPPDLVRRIETQFNAKAAPGNGYGLTETTSAVIANGGADYLAHPTSVGRPVVTADIRVVDDAGEDVPTGVVGEVWIRGPNVIVGYWRNPGATEASFGGGWFRSGDLGYVDENGLYYIVDRKKDVIIRGGENIYCAEVEAAILEHPLVLDAAVIGLPNADYGEEVAAVIRVDTRDQFPSLQADIVTGLAAKLARFKIPTTIRIVNGDLPRTATGKVLKREMRTEFFGERSLR